MKTADEFMAEADAALKAKLAADEMEATRSRLSELKQGRDAARDMWHKYLYVPFGVRYDAVSSDEDEIPIGVYFKDFLLEANGTDCFTVHRKCKDCGEWLNHTQIWLQPPDSKEADQHNLIEFAQAMHAEESPHFGCPARKKALVDMDEEAQQWHRLEPAEKQLLLALRAYQQSWFEGV